jgi:hypothetical protein
MEPPLSACLQAVGDGELMAPERFEGWESKRSCGRREQATFGLYFTHSKDGNDLARACLLQDLEEGARR